MSEQMNNGMNLDELMATGGLDFGGDGGDYDPFAESSDQFEEQDADEPEEPDDGELDDDESEDDESENVTHFPAEAPFAPQTQGTAQQQTENSTPAKTVKAAPASNVTAPDFNPLAAAVGKAEEQNLKAGAASILAKPPVFAYGSATEDITDKMLTFEQLRIAKSEDFPELDDQKKVTWTMEYGKISKAVPKPKETVIHKLKEEIETSKEFLEQLKKQKDKPETLICKVKPRIIAQSKGIVSAYKGVFTSLEEAEQSNKPICILPSRDGKVYEIRCTEAGKFVVPVTDVPELSEVSAGFFPVLPPVPFPIICQVIGFFRHFMGEQELEAMVHIYWDKLHEEYRVAVPVQQVEKAHIDAQIDTPQGAFSARTAGIHLVEDVLDESRYICFADIHSHNSMPAIFSSIDDHDERATRVYMVIGHLERYFPEINARISIGGKFLPVPLTSMIGGLPEDFPHHWVESVQLASAICRREAEETL